MYQCRVMPGESPPSCDVLRFAPDARTGGQAARKLYKRSRGDCIDARPGNIGGAGITRVGAFRSTSGSLAVNVYTSTDFFK